MQNENGFLVDENGVLRGIEISISNEPVTGLPRLAYHDSLQIARNFQMIHRVGVVTLTADGSKTARESAKDIVVDPRLLNAYLDSWQDKVLPFNTEGTLINPATGAVIKNDTGGIEQLAWMQQLTVMHLAAMGLPVSTSTPTLVQVYTMLKIQIQQYDADNRL